MYDARNLYLKTNNNITNDFTGKFDMTLSVTVALLVDVSQLVFKHVFFCLRQRVVSGEADELSRK